MQRSLPSFRFFVAASPDPFASTMAAIDREGFNRSVLVKRVPEAFKEDAGRHWRLEREAEILSNLKVHGVPVPLGRQGGVKQGRWPSIVGMVQGDAKTAEGQALVLPFAGTALALPYYPYRTLAETLRAHHDAALGGGASEFGQASFRRLLECFCSLCSVVAQCHARGVVHRDIKPENVLVCADGSALLIDFGRARVFLPPAGSIPAGEPPIELDHSDDHLPPGGTPEYHPSGLFAPERRSLAENQRDEVFALGATLYVLLVGAAPYQAGLPSKEAFPSFVPPRARNRKVPAALESLVLKAMFPPRADDTLGSAAEFGAEVRRWLDGEALTKVPEPPRDWFGRFARRRPRVANWLVSATALAACLAMLLASYEYRRRRTAEDGQRLLKRSAASEALNRANHVLAKGLYTELSNDAANSLRGEDRLARLDAFLPLGDAAGLATALNTWPESGDGIPAKVHLLRAELRLSGVDERGFDDAKSDLERALGANALPLSVADRFYAQGLQAATARTALAAFENALQVQPLHYRANVARLATQFLLGQRDEAREQARFMKRAFDDADGTADVFLLLCGLFEGRPLAELEPEFEGGVERRVGRIAAARFRSMLRDWHPRLALLADVGDERSRWTLPQRSVVVLRKLGQDVLALDPRDLRAVRLAIPVMPWLRDSWGEMLRIASELPLPEPTTEYDRSLLSPNLKNHANTAMDWRTLAATAARASARFDETMFAYLQMNAHAVAALSSLNAPPREQGGRPQDGLAMEAEALARRVAGGHTLFRPLRDEADLRAAAFALARAVQREPGNRLARRPEEARIVAVLTREPWLVPARQRSGVAAATCQWLTSNDARRVLLHAYAADPTNYQLPLALAQVELAALHPVHAVHLAYEAAFLRFGDAWRRMNARLSSVPRTP